MSFRFITVKRSDPDFDDYITGAFSGSERAIPMGSYNIRSKSDFVTFKIVDSEASDRPHRLRVIWEGLRPNLLTITVSPVLLSVLILLHLGQSINWGLAFFSTCALMFLHFSVFLLNDFFDHYKGRDQVNRSKGSRIIQNGWATAKAVRFWGAFNLVLGIAFGVPALLQKPLVVSAIGGLAIVIILGFSSFGKGLRDTILGEILVSLSLGPLLVTGFCLTVSNNIPVDALVVGVIFGWMSSLIFQIKNLEEMVTTYQNRGQSLIQKLGFDKGKRFIQWQLLFLPPVALVLFQFVFAKLLLSFCTLSMFMTCYWLERRIRRADSPMSSILTGASGQMATIHMKNIIFFVVIFFPPVV